MTFSGMKTGFSEASLANEYHYATKIEEIWYGLRIRERLSEVITIVKPETLLKWHRRMKQKKWTYDNTQKRNGRPCKDKQTEQLVVKLAEENTWGYLNHYYIDKEAA